MKKTGNIIDIFVNIVDNYGDMGFACEFIQACKDQFKNEFLYTIWTNDVIKMQEFVHKSGILYIDIENIVDFGLDSKSSIGISLLHAPIPHLDFFQDSALILRIDYLSLDPLWIENNGKEYIGSTLDRQIIELIPSPLNNSIGLLPIISGGSAVSVQKHIVIFAYGDAMDRIDWDSFPLDIQIFVFGEKIHKRGNITQLDFLSIFEFYSLIDTSEFVIIRGEVTFAHIIQTGIPFFWNMYSDIGGFPVEQSAQFLSMIDASPEYRNIHAILNGQKGGKIYYGDFIGTCSHTQLSIHSTHNLIHTVKKNIDRFNNSIY